MRLSKYLRPAPDFAEFGFRCASSLAGQAVTENVVTTVKLNTLITDDTGIMSAPVANTFVVPPGVWAVEAWATLSSTAYYQSSILSLFDATNSKTVAVATHSGHGVYSLQPRITTQIRLSSATNFQIKVLTNVASDIASYAYGTPFTNSSANTDQRASVKLWKLE